MPSTPLGRSSVAMPRAWIPGLCLAALAIAAILSLAAPAPASAGTCTGMTATLLPAGTKAPDGSTLSAPIGDWEQISGQCSQQADTVRVTVPDCQPGCGGSNHRQIVEWWAHAPEPPGCTASTTTNPNDTLTCEGKADGRICFYIKKSPGPSAATAISAEPVHVVFGDATTFDASPSLGAAAPGCGPADHPHNTSPPTISGSTYPGQTLTCNVGMWSGTPPLTPTYQWKKNGVPIPGATGSTYVPTQSDVGATIDCEVTMTNAEGDTATASSAQAPVLPEPKNPQEAQNRWLYKQQFGKDPGPGPGSVVISPSPAPSSELTLTDLVLAYLKVYPIKPKAFEIPRLAFPSAAAPTQIGTLPNVHFAPGQASATVPIQLSAKGRKLLAHSKRITVQVTGKLTGATGDITGTFKMVPPKKKKKK